MTTLSYVTESFVDHPIESMPICGSGGAGGAEATRGGDGGDGGGAVVLQASYIDAPSLEIKLYADATSGGAATLHGGSGGGGGGGFARCVYRNKSTTTLTLAANGKPAGAYASGSPGVAGAGGIAISKQV